MRSDVIRQLQKPHARVTLELDDPAPPGTDLQFEAPIVGRATLSNVGRYVRAAGRLRTVIGLACSRCLCPVSYELEAEIEEFCVLEQIDEPAAYAGTGDEEADPIPILDEEIIDLSELVRQCVVVAAPATVVCRDDCRGLCPHCGRDLNQETCDCARDEIDPRWSALQNLLAREEE